ncbi:hypothetical protein DSO57_1012247 [Entomophthora muscae]|uniref:Uncharacterized protein n=1 Tax=Entomophthora muscae TaxID=34485 RepID=A0ACC2S7U1_9FUNG|nr:hypothetical protein DSO57_1012247 [Entomophthora muscae]
MVSIIGVIILSLLWSDMIISGVDGQEPHRKPLKKFKQARKLTKASFSLQPLQPCPYLITREIVSSLIEKLHKFRLINRQWISAIILVRYLYQDTKFVVSEPIVEIEKYAPPKNIRRTAFLQEDVKAQDVPRDYNALFALTINVFSLNFCTGIQKAWVIMAVSNQLERITQISMCLGKGEHHLLIHKRGVAGRMPKEQS